MTPRGFAVLTCRLVAVLLIAFALQQLALNAQTFAVSGLGLGARTVSFAAGMFAPLAGAAILWFGAGRIAGFADDSGPVAGVALDETAFVRAGTALIGLAVASLAAAAGIAFESLMLAHHTAEGHDPAYAAAIERQALEQRVHYLARIALGVLLILGRDRIAGWLGRSSATR